MNAVKIKNALTLPINTPTGIRASIAVSGYALSSPPMQASIIRTGGSLLHQNT
ncbi:MAG: hypothetical protein WCV87_00665 [Candidatus Paceibacterota bacterium]